MAILLSSTDINDSVWLTRAMPAFSDVVLRIVYLDVPGPVCTASHARSVPPKFSLLRYQPQNSRPGIERNEWQLDGGIISPGNWRHRLLFPSVSCY